MKKYIESVMLMLIGLVAFSACSDDDTNYQWATASGEQVYFSNALPSKTDLSFEESSFTIQVSRVKTDEAITVPLSLEEATGVFTAPSSVSFAAGSKTADLVISYDPAKLEYDNYISGTLSISDKQYTTPYGSSAYTFSAGVPSPYVSIGTGTFIEDFYFGFSAKVEIMQNQENPNVFRIYGAYDDVDGGTQSEYLELTVLHSGQTLNDVPITIDGLVYWPAYNTGYHHSSYDADIKIYHPSAFSDYGAEENWVLSRVLAYQDDGVTPGQIQLAPCYYMDGVGGWASYSQNTEGMVIINFPGYTPLDFSLDLTYTGIFTSVSGEVFAAGELALGEDATNAKAVVVSASEDAEEVAAAIAAGTMEAVDVTAGNINVPIADGMTGKLQLVVAVLYEDEVKAVQSAVFEYYGGGSNPWVSLGIGLMTDNFVVTMYSPDGESVFEPLTYEVEIEENTDYPGLYRVVDAFAQTAEFLEVGFTSANLEVNAVDPEGVYIEAQATGVDDGDGMVYIASYGGYALGSYDFDTVKGAGYLGTLKDGIITLPVFENSNGTPFQGVFFQGSGSWYTGSVGEFRLVLPNTNAASAIAKKAPVMNAKARSFEKRLNAYNKVDKAAMKKAMRALRLKKIQKAQMK